MASITRLFKYFPLVHVQGEAHTFIIVTKGGESTGGRGFGCWFWPVGTAISEVPLSDQSVSLTLKGKTRDFQEVTVTAQAWYEVTDARIISSRFDFSVNVATGEFNSDPLTVIEGALTSAAQAAVWDHVAQFNLTDILTSGLEKLAEEVSAALSNLDFGVTVGRVAIMQVRPDAAIEKALQAETREGLQMKADAAGFARRATATEQERAIEEATLKNQLELAKQRTAVIDINGVNTKREAESLVESARIRSEGELAIATRKADDARRIKQADVESALAARVKEAAASLQINSDTAAVELANQIAVDAQAAAQRTTLNGIDLAQDQAKVALYSTEEGADASAALARIGIPTALSNVRVMGTEALQLVLGDLE